ncbi:hypothetical protein [Candidatus Pyrohabitans sp.]
MSVFIEVLAKMLRHLDEDALEELFDMVMVEYDTSPLSEEEKRLVSEAEKAYNEGDVVVKSLEEI